MPDASPLAQFLFDKDKQNPIEEITLIEKVHNSDLMLLSKCLTSRPAIKNVPLRAQIVNRLFQVFIKTPHSSVRQTLAENLVDTGGKEINEFLLKLLSSDRTELNVRQCIVYALVRHGKHFATIDLIQTAIKTHDKSLKDVISYGLSQMSEIIPTSVLLQILIQGNPQHDTVFNSIWSTLSQREGHSLIIEIEQKLTNGSPIDPITHKKLLHLLQKLKRNYKI